ncbi:MAG: hypothetical protein J6O61_04970 [Butyrivibrio sp.]|nr:hypothetical protein [Butyrivibrio sp.]
MQGRFTMIGCPKPDEGDYTEKLTEVISNKDVRHCEAYRIIVNPAYDSKYPENERFFKFMVIKREVKTSAQVQNAAFMSKNELLKKMLG